VLCVCVCVCLCRCLYMCVYGNLLSLLLHRFSCFNCDQEVSKDFQMYHGKPYCGTCVLKTSTSLRCKIRTVKEKAMKLKTGLLSCSYLFVFLSVVCLYHPSILVLEWSCCAVCISGIPVRVHAVYVTLYVIC